MVMIIYFYGTASLKTEMAYYSQGDLVMYHLQRSKRK